MDIIVSIQWTTSLLRFIEVCDMQPYSKEWCWKNPRYNA